MALPAPADGDDGVPDVSGTRQSVPFDDTSAVTGLCRDRSSCVSKLLRGVAAGWGAKKMGGGCLSTVVIFIVLWYVLGHFNIFR